MASVEVATDALKHSFEKDGVNGEDLNRHDIEDSTAMCSMVVLSTKLS